MSDQTLFQFATMTAAEIKDDREQLRLPLQEKPKDGAGGFRLVPCSSCGGSTFDDGARPLVCHCGATITGDI